MLRLAGTSCKLRLVNTVLSCDAVHQAEQVEAFAPPSVHEEVGPLNDAISYYLQAGLAAHFIK